MATESGDGTNGSDLGGFGHAESIEPGALEDNDADRPLIDVPELPDPEGLEGAHDEDADD